MAGLPTRAAKAAFLVPLALLALLGTLYVAAGENIPVAVTDQLDGEVFTYLLRAWNPGATEFSQFMNGVPGTSLQMASPLTLLFYYALPSATAFSANAVFVMFVGYAGLFFLLRQLQVRTVLAAAASFVFALLPFYSVYGLSVMGIPLAALAVVLAFRGGKGRIAVAFTLVLLFGGFSSLVLSGYAVLVAMALAFVVALCLRKKNTAWCLVGLMAALVAVYTAGNMDLILQTLGLSDAPASHKTELALTPVDFSWADVFDQFFNGQWHAASCQTALAVFCLAALCILGFLCAAGRGSDAGNTPSVRGRTCALAAILLACFLIAVFKEWYQTQMAISLRELLPGSLKAFQLDRFYWLYPALWFTAFALAADTLWSVVPRGRKGVGKHSSELPATHAPKVARAALSALAAVVLVLTVGFSAPSNALLANIGTMATGQSMGHLTWEQFFAEDLFAQAREDLAKQGEASSEIRVVSVGMHPSVALYNGFYCLDGYSNNYPLAYKHAFRAIDEGEFAVDSDIRDYFDHWGNRCYCFTHELGFTYLVPKNSGITLQDCRLNFAAAKSLGAQYVFSSVRIAHAKRLGLEKVGAYETDASYYRLYLYKIL